MEREQQVEIARKLYRLLGGRGRASRGVRAELYEMIWLVEQGRDEWEPHASPGEWLLRRGAVSLRANPERRGGSKGTKYIATITPHGRRLVEQASAA